MIRNSLTKGKFLLPLLLLIAGFSGFAAEGEAGGDPENVRYILTRIKTTLQASIDAEDWRKKYDLAAKNIEDLGRTLRQNGAGTKQNPVRDHDRLLGEMLEERSEQFQIYYETQMRMMELRKREAKVAINDIWMEMVNRLSSPKPGVFAPLTQAQSKNVAIIKEDMKNLKKIDDAIQKLEDYKNNILPSIHAIRDRRQELQPLLQLFRIACETSFNGRYSGDFSGEASGTLSFTVTGNSVSGEIHGMYKNMPVRGTLNGRIDDAGNLGLAISGTATDKSDLKMGNFQFSGSLRGQVQGGVVRGKWFATDDSTKAAGSWSAAKPSDDDL